MTTTENSPIPKSSTLWTRIRRRWGVLAIVALVLLGVFWRTLAGPWTLFYAIENRNRTLAQVALTLFVSPNVITSDGYTALAASALCRPDFVRMLIDKGADPRAGGRFAPLLMVSSLDVCPSAGQIIDTLVEAGLKVETCAGGISVLENTVAPETVDALLRHGVDPNNLCSPSGHSPLFNAVERPAILKLLLDHGARILPDDRTKLTPLHTAAALGRKAYQTQNPQRFESVEILLAHGADINAVSNEEKTPLDGAYEQGDKEMADLLIKHGAKAKNHKSLEEASDARDTENEYNELFRVAEGVRKGPACSLHIQGDSEAVMEEGPNWSIVRGTVAEVQVNCRAGGYFHYAVVGMGSPVPKALNMPLSSGTASSAKIEFDKAWYHGVMHWYYSRERITNLVSALNKGTATHFAVRNVTVGE